MANKTILKWAGSKARIIEKLRPYLPKTQSLIEPFAGSLAILMNTHYDHYLIADANADLINLYRIIIHRKSAFIHRANQVFTAFGDRQHYYQLRTQFNESNLSLFERAVYFLYLNRYGYRGLCRYNQQGHFNVPFGDDKQPYFPLTEITAFTKKLNDQVDIICRDWHETLSGLNGDEGIYCDPPYMGDKNSFTQYYSQVFDDKAQEDLAETLKNIHHKQGNPITVSNSIIAKSLYADLGFTVHEISAPRTIAANGNRQPAKEIIAVLGSR